MKILNKAFDILMGIIGEQSITESEYRLLKYVREVEVDNQYLFFNTFTNEILALKKEEMTYFNNGIRDEIFNTMVSKWFLVPKDFDDVSLCSSYEKTIDAIRENSSLKGISLFTILPTTDCNARCFYCYELGCKHIDMTEDTAFQVVNYILNNKREGIVKLRWFGGEPLYNVKIIDFICSQLRSRNILFESTMTSNGYLFNDEIVSRAKELWNLKSVQITLDGTEAIYNKTKAYIYKSDPSPFKTVIDNMERLLERGIMIKNRLNMDQHNDVDLFKLVDYLLDKFSKFDCYYVYVHGLMDNCTAKLQERTKEQRALIDKKCRELQEIIDARTTKKLRPTYIKQEMFRCMADNDSAVMILPDGSLGKCEHYLDEHHIGSVFSDSVDFSELKWYKRFRLPVEQCAECEFRPVCRALDVCPGTRTKCDNEIKQSTRLGIEKYIEDLYFQDRKNTLKRENEII